jgi:hypothetical protein
LIFFRCCHRIIPLASLRGQQTDLTSSLWYKGQYEPARCRSSRAAYWHDVRRDFNPRDLSHDRGKQKYHREAAGGCRSGVLRVSEDRAVPTTKKTPENSD